MIEGDYHWGSDPYWTEAMHAYLKLRENGASAVSVDIAMLDERIFQDQFPYRFAEAMHSVIVHEGMDGHRGAPRLVMALLAKLIELGVASAERR